MQKQSNEPTPRAAAYIRVSSAQQVEGYSPGEQRRRLTAYIKSRNWEPADIYEDAGISGRREDRPQLARLLADLPTIDKVVVVALSRLGRSARHSLELFEQFRAAGVELVSLNEGFDTSTAMGRMLPKLLMVLAEWESEQIGERVRGVMRARVESGKHLAARAYGYRRAGVTRKGKPTGPLVPYPDEAVIVLRIFVEFANGTSQARIARGLNLDGIPSPRGARWYQGTVRRILDNPIYAGRVVLDGEEFPGEHEAIVDPVTSERVATIRRAMAEENGRPRGRLPVAGHLFIRGALKCGNCGESMKPRSDGKVPVYACYGRAALGPEHCPMDPVPMTVIDGAVFKYFEDVGLDREETRREIEEQRDRHLAKVRGLRERAEQDEREAAESLDRVRRDYSRGALPVEELNLLLPGLIEEHTAATAKLDRLRDQEREVAASAPHLDAEEETLRHLAEVRAAVASEVRDAGSVEVVRAALARLFETFVLCRVEDTPLADPQRRTRRVVHNGGEAASPFLMAGDFVILPRVRRQAIARYSEDGIVPVLHGTPLAQAETNESHVSW